VACTSSAFREGEAAREAAVAHLAVVASLPFVFGLALAPQRELVAFDGDLHALGVNAGRVCLEVECVASHIALDLRHVTHAQRSSGTPRLLPVAEGTAEERVHSWRI